MLVVAGVLFIAARRRFAPSARTTGRSVFGLDSREHVVMTGFTRMPVVTVGATPTMIGLLGVFDIAR